MATVLKSGELAPSVPKDKTAKSYYHMVRGARFVMPDGLEVVFRGGIFTTKDPEIIAELDKVADRPASMVYTKNETAEAVLAAAKAAADDAVQKTTAGE
jgi:hypothetical protein